MDNTKQEKFLTYVLHKKKLLPSKVLQLIFQAENPKKHLKYRAGQYALIKTPNNKLMPYSIANAPSEDKHIELHIRVNEQDEQLMKIIKNIDTTKKIEIAKAEGRCHLPDNKKPLLCLAGGTGFAAIKAILEQAVFENDKREIIFYWSVKNKKGIYLAEELKKLSSKLDNFSYLILSSEDMIENIPNKTCSIKTMLTEFPKQLTDYNVIAAGPYAIVLACWEEAQHQKLPAEQFYTDML